MPVAVGSPGSEAEGWKSLVPTVLYSIRKGRMLQRKVLDQNIFHW